MPRFDARHVAQVGNELGHAVNVANNGLDELFLHVVDVAHRANHFGVIHDGGHRVFEFVGDFGDEFAFFDVGALDSFVEEGVGESHGRSIA